MSALLIRMHPLSLRASRIRLFHLVSRDQPQLRAADERLATSSEIDQLRAAHRASTAVALQAVSPLR